MTSTPIYHSAVHQDTKRPRVARATEYGNAASFWVEYPSGLVDLTRTTHLPSFRNDHAKPEGSRELIHEDVVKPPPLHPETQWELDVDADRVLRITKVHCAIVIVDMQKYVPFVIRTVSIPTGTEVSVRDPANPESAISCTQI